MLNIVNSGRHCGWPLLNRILRLVKSGRANIRYNRLVLIPLRDESPGFGVPFVVLLLIGLNVYAFYLQLTFAGGFGASIESWGAVPKAIVTFTDFPPQTGYPPAVTLITSMFMHGGFMHILGNMWFLWIFGDNCEWLMGRFKFVVFYLLCGLAAAVAQIAISPMSLVPMVGASGAIAGVMAAYVLHFPRERILSLLWIFVFVRVVFVPAWLYIGIWILMQLYLGFGSAAAAGDTGGVAYFAHIGGFFAGFFFAKLFARKDFRLKRNRRHFDVEYY